MFHQTHQRNHLLSVLALLLLAALACSAAGNSDLEKPIVGLWQREDGKETIELFEDGSVIIPIPSLNITWTGTFKFIDDNTLQIEEELLDETITSVYGVELAQDMLTLTSEDGISATYTRVK